MSRIFVDRISPYQSGSVQVDGLNIDTGSLTTKTEFNDYTSSNDGKVNSLIAETGSYAQESVVSQLVSATSSYAQESVVSQLVSATGSFATTGANTFVGNQIISGNLNLGPTNNFTSRRIQISDRFRLEGTFEDDSKNYRNTLNLNGLFRLENRTDFYGVGLSLQSDDPGIYNLSSSIDIYTDILFPGIPLPKAQIVFQRGDNYTDGTVTFPNPVQLEDVLKLSQQDPLPTGSLGQLAVSGSDLYYNDGNNWVQLN